jgi:hypothetical protein
VQQQIFTIYLHHRLIWRGLEVHGQKRVSPS